MKVVNDNDDAIGADDRDNDPHVCTFHLYGFHFDNNASGTWQIESWPPTGDRTVVASGTWTADGTGQWAVPGPALADGHYELDARQTTPAPPGSDKNKVFWVKCATSTGASTGTGSGTSTGTSSGTSTTTTGNAVAGFQAPPSNGVGTVSPIVQAPSNTAVNGVQSAPSVAGVQGLPSTSTSSGPAIPLAALCIVLISVGGAILRRGSTQA